MENNISANIEELIEDNFFYSQIDEDENNSELLKNLRDYSFKTSKQVFVINKPLGEKKYEYQCENAFVILIPKVKLIFLNNGTDSESFDEFIDEFIEDIGVIADKYGYRDVLGRPRKWRYIFTIEHTLKENESVLDVITDNTIEDKTSERNIELLISLLTGSINDIAKVGSSSPIDLLDAIKRKIILFDADQTKFIYKEPVKKRITIQGLAGTGKTELLMHKLKDIYIKEPTAKIVFTCHNKVLSKNLKARIPNFFDFMKVEEQIKWNERLWVMSSWGSRGDKNSGLYSFICNTYNINFLGYNSANFDYACTQALNDLNSRLNFTPLFDYILIDESQDFPNIFFDLCEKVSAKRIFIAGDIFQNIFDEDIESKVSPDFLLNKCYRTDPKTLMFAHGLGMGLFENQPLRWLTDNEWKACGYLIDKSESDIYNLSRKPLRRFEDLEEVGFETIKIISSPNIDFSDKILDIIKNIKEKYETVEPDDIGIIFLENVKDNYNLASRLQFEIYQHFNWPSTIGYESKEKLKGAVFISNRNNVKGLEFPFIICVAQNKLTDNLNDRNALYMMLTRSFLTSYLLLPNMDYELISKFENSIKDIIKTGNLKVKIPSPPEQERLRNAIITYNKDTPLSKDEIISKIFEDLNVKTENKEKLKKSLEALDMEMSEDIMFTAIQSLNDTLEKGYKK